MPRDILLIGTDSDILIRGGVIIGRGRDLPHRPDAEIFDTRGLLLTRGFTDLHVHFREPGQTYKETIASGSAAAARGGFTTVCTMPNLDPAPDSPEHLAVQQALIRRDALINVLPYGCITKGRAGKEAVDFAAMKAAGCVAFSDDGSGVQDDDTMRRCMEAAAAAGCTIAAHCEVNSLLHGGYIHDGRYARAHGHRGISSESEWREVERDLKLAEETGCRFHVCHVSTKESVELIRAAKARGVKVSCETAPHYLVFCEDELQEEGRWKMNPPLRSAEDRDALRAALADGTIDAVATDHAPHSREEKSRGLEGSAMGIVGLETAFPALYTVLVRGGIISLERLLEAMHFNPFFAPDLQKADFTAIDLDESFIVDPASFLSKGRSTPFEGMELRGKVKFTICNGQTVYRDDI